MGSREKLALFNMLTGYLQGITPAKSEKTPLNSGKFAGLMVLDAYAGSGALGIEALSRGAKSVIFVEKSPEVAKIISQNLENLGLTELSQIFRQNVRNFCEDYTKKFHKNPQNAQNPLFDLILADPPYNHFDPTEVNKLAQLLAPEGIMALSHPGDAPKFPGLEVLKARSYANAHLTLYRKY